jgi:DNA-binding MarR family transcriptional regulator
LKEQDRVLADRWHSLALHILRRVRRRDAESGLGSGQLSALSVIVFRGPLSLGDLATIEQVRPPTITRFVRDLNKAGLIMLRTDPQDARVTRVQATARGERRLAIAREKRIRELAETFGPLSVEERHLLLQAADLLEDRVEPRHRPDDHGRPAGKASKRRTSP